jgi:hypothetical protein
MNPTTGETPQEMPERVYIDPYENRTYVGTWHLLPPEGGEGVEYIPASTLTRELEAVKAENTKLRELLGEAKTFANMSDDILEREPNGTLASLNDRITAILKEGNPNGA